jgi:hypothetical protein
MPSDNGRRSKVTKVNGDSWGGGGPAGRRWGKRPLFSARNRRSEEKDRPLKRSNSQRIGSRLCNRPLTLNKCVYRPDGHRALSRSSPRISPTPRNPRGAADIERIKTNLPMMFDEDR